MICPDLDCRGRCGQRPRRGVPTRDEDVSVGTRDPFAVDPALVERGLRGHARTQNALATFVRSRGGSPRSPRPDEPNFDLAWELDGVTWVAEVKSTTDANEE